MKKITFKKILSCLIILVGITVGNAASSEASSSCESITSWSECNSHTPRCIWKDSPACNGVYNESNCCIPAP